MDIICSHVVCTAHKQVVEGKDGLQIQDRVANGISSHGQPRKVSLLASGFDRGLKIPHLRKLECYEMLNMA
jgi:hypothetical protein